MFFKQLENSSHRIRVYVYEEENDDAHKTISESSWVKLKLSSIRLVLTI